MTRNGWEEESEMPCRIGLVALELDRTILQAILLFPAIIYVIVNDKLLAEP